MDHNCSLLSECGKLPANERRIPTTERILVTIAFKGVQIVRPSIPKPAFDLHADGGAKTTIDGKWTRSTASRVSSERVR